MQRGTAPPAGSACQRGAPPRARAQAHSKSPIAEVDLKALEAERPEPEESTQKPISGSSRSRRRRRRRRRPSDNNSSRPPPLRRQRAGPSEPPPPPRIPLKYIGDMTDPKNAGKRIAILSDARGAYYGREGDVIEGRYRIVTDRRRINRACVSRRTRAPNHQTNRTINRDMRRLTQSLRARSCHRPAHRLRGRPRVPQRRGPRARRRLGLGRHLLPDGGAGRSRQARVPHRARARDAERVARSISTTRARWKPRTSSTRRCSSTGGRSSSIRATRRRSTGSCSSRKSSAIAIEASRPKPAIAAACANRPARSRRRRC